MKDGTILSKITMIWQATSIDTVGKPDIVVRGNKGTLKAARNIGRRKWLVVVYRELSKHDGFVITAYLLDTKPKGEIVWRQ